MTKGVTHYNVKHEAPRRGRFAPGSTQIMGRLKTLVLDLKKTAQRSGDYGGIGFSGRDSQTRVGMHPHLVAISLTEPRRRSAMSFHHSPYYGLLLPLA